MQAVEAAKTAAKSISETVAEDSESSVEEGKEAPAGEQEQSDDSDDEEKKKSKAALDKLVNASEESLLSQVGCVKYVHKKCDIWTAFLCSFHLPFRILFCSVPMAIFLN